MGISDSMKQAFEKLTGEAQRKDQERLAHEAEMKEQSRLAAEQIERSRLAAERGHPAAQAAEKARQQEAAQKQQNQKPPGPGDRLFANTGREQQLKAARERSSEAQPAPAASIPAATPAQVAERMQLQPAGHQRGPSPAGGNYANPRVVQARQAEAAPKAPQPAPRECLADQIERQIREREAGMTPEQREAERSIRQKAIRRENLSRTLDDDHNQGRENKL